MTDPVDIDIYHLPTDTTPTTLTDERAGYGEPTAPSEAALETVDRLEVYLATLEMTDVQGEDAKADLARWFDRFAQEAVRVWKRDAIEALESQLIPPPLTPRMERYNSVLNDAIGIIRKP